MEQWNYEEIKKYINESFEGFLGCGETMEKSTSSVIYEYEDIINNSHKEGVMIYTAIFKYLNKSGQNYDWFNKIVATAYGNCKATEILGEELKDDIKKISKQIEV